MPFARWALRGLLVASVAVSSGCGIVDPCSVGADLGMSGTWELTRVNGDPIPSVGYPLPFPSTDRLTAGFLKFKRLKETGKCENNDELKSEGRVVAAYSLVTASGQSKPAKLYAGTYLYNNSTGTVTLKAFKKSVDGDRFGEEFTVRPEIPLVGTYTLTFERVSFK